ncbi:MAG TPA: DMT family transporter [Chryseolinea sp.]|nr:DMT family transporter [Chryseolinea sp.]
MGEKKFNSYFVGGILLCLFGAICFSTKAIFVKLAYRDTDVDPVTLLALRMIFSLPFFVVSAFISSNQSTNVKFTQKQWLAIAGIGCLGYYVSSLLDFLGLQYVTAGIERLILFVYPTLVLVISATIFKTRITSWQWLALGLTYAGLIAACLPEIQGKGSGENFWKGSLLILVCALTYAMYIVGSGKLIPVVGSSKFNSYAMSFAAAAVIIHFFVTSNAPLTEQPARVYAYSFAMAIISTVIPSYLISEGIKRVGSGNAAIIGSVGPVSTILQASIFLQEPVYGLQLLGTGFILAGVLMVGQKKQAEV